MNIIQALDYVLCEFQDEYTGEEKHSNISITVSFIDENGLKNVSAHENFKEIIYPPDEE